MVEVANAVSHNKQQILALYEQNANLMPSVGEQLQNWSDQIEKSSALKIDQLKTSLKNQYLSGATFTNSNPPLIQAGGAPISSSMAAKFEFLEREIQDLKNGGV